MGDRRRIQLLILSTFILIGVVNGEAVAEMKLSKNSSSVVLLTLADTDIVTAWPSAEERIRDELEIAGMSVTCLSWEGGKQTAERFALAAETQGADQALMVRKESRTGATLSFFSIDQPDGHSELKQIEITWPAECNEREAVDVVAFKTMEAVRAAGIVVTKIEPPPEPEPQKTPLPAPPLPSRLERLKPLVITGLAAGIAGIVVGGSLHGVKFANARDANEIASKASSAPSRIGDAYQSEYDSYVADKKTAKNAGTGMIVSYTVGGLLAVTGAALLVVIQKRERKRETAQSVSLQPTGNGFIVRF